MLPWISPDSGRQTFEHILDGDRVAEAVIDHTEAHGYFEPATTNYELEVVDTSWHQGLEVENPDIKIAQSYTVCIPETADGEEIADGSREIIHFDTTRYYQTDESGEKIVLSNPVVDLMLQASKLEKEGVVDKEWVGIMRAMANRLHRQMLEMEKVAGEGPLATHLGFMAVLNEIQEDLGIEPTR